METKFVDIQKMVEDTKTNLIAYIKQWVGLKNILYSILKFGEYYRITDIEENGVRIQYDYSVDTIERFENFPIDELYKLADYLTFNYEKEK